MLYSASRRFSSTSRRCRSRSMSVGSGTALPADQEPDQREPQLARVRHGAIVDEDLGVVQRPDDLEQVAQPRGVARPEARAIARGGAAPGLTEFRRAPRDVER